MPCNAKPTGRRTHIPRDRQNMESSDRHGGYEGPRAVVRSNYESYRGDFAPPSPAQSGVACRRPSSEFKQRLSAPSHLQAIHPPISRLRVRSLSQIAARGPVPHTGFWQSPCARHFLQGWKPAISLLTGLDCRGPGPMHRCHPVVWLSKSSSLVKFGPLTVTVDIHHDLLTPLLDTKRVSTIPGFHWTALILSGSPSTSRRRRSSRRPGRPAESSSSGDLRRRPST